MILDIATFQTATVVSEKGDYKGPQAVVDHIFGKVTVYQTGADYVAQQNGEKHGPYSLAMGLAMARRFVRKAIAERTGAR